MGWFATDARIAERLLRERIGDAAILHTITGVGKRCLFCTREAVWLVTYRQWLPFLAARATAVRSFPFPGIMDLTVEERGDGTVCRLGLATSSAHLPPEGGVPDAQAILFVTLLAPGFREMLKSIRYLVESRQFKASWEAGAPPGESAVGG